MIEHEHEVIDNCLRFIMQQQLDSFRSNNQDDHHNNAQNDSSAGPNSVPNVSELVEGVLASPWGRPIRPVPPNSETLVMHQWIAAIGNSSPFSSSSTRATPEREGNTTTPSWEDIIARCETHPFEAAHLDRRGRTCLHAACAKKPPLAAVHAILQACGRHGETVLEKDKHGRTPLILAVCSNADLAVISLLLTKCPKATMYSDHLGDLPLHLACGNYDCGQDELVRMLLSVYPGAARQESFNGRTPLHSAVENGAPVSVVRQLVKGKRAIVD